MEKNKITQNKFRKKRGMEKGAHFAQFGPNGEFFQKNQVMSLSSLYSSLTSCKIMKMSIFGPICTSLPRFYPNQKFPKKFCYGTF